MNDTVELSREQMEAWLILEGWQVYNHADDQSWDAWGFSKGGKECMFAYRHEAGHGQIKEMCRSGLDRDEVPFPMSRVPEDEIQAMYAWAIGENNEP